MELKNNRNISWLFFVFSMAMHVAKINDECLLIWAGIFYDFRNIWSNNSGLEECICLHQLRTYLPMSAPMCRNVESDL